MNYADYYDCDICNGKSTGMSLFVSGCHLHCKGCFNPETWDFNYGKEWTKSVKDNFINLAGRDYIKRISFLGGSPLCDENVTDVALIIQELKYNYPDKQIWVYTGYKWEDVNGELTPNKLANDYRHEILSYIDVLVDGPFEYDKKDLTLAFRGSTNQRIIDVKQTLKSGEVVLYKDED